LALVLALPAMPAIMDRRPVTHTAPRTAVIPVTTVQASSVVIGVVAGDMEDLVAEVDSVGMALAVTVEDTVKARP